MKKRTRYCDNPLCEAEAVRTVSVSIKKPGDSTRHYCEACYEAYCVGVQHGRLSENPFAYASAERLKGEPTPPPWRIKGWQIFAADRQVNDNLWAHRICEFEPQGCREVDREIAANMALVAAAPKLRQSCQELLGLVQVLRRNRTLAPSQSEILIRAEAALTLTHQLKPHQRNQR